MPRRRREEEPPLLNLHNTADPSSISLGTASNKSFLEGLLSFYLVLLLTLAADQLTKFFALRGLSQIDTVEIIPKVFHLTLVHNTGIAFGFFRQHPSILLALITLSLLFIFFWGRNLPSENKMERFALALILGGAVGNWLDRLRFGAVIDFLDFRVWPVFNLADSAITVGVTLFAWMLLKKKSS